MNSEIDNKEMLLLVDENETMYAIPREVVESYLLTDEQKVNLKKYLGDDVSGYTMYESHVNEQLTATYMAEKVQRSEAARQLREAHQQDEPEENRDAEVRIGSRLVGRFISALSILGLRTDK